MTADRSIHLRWRIAPIILAGLLAGLGAGPAEAAVNASTRAFDSYLAEGYRQLAEVAGRSAAGDGTVAYYRTRNAQARRGGLVAPQGIQGATLDPWTLREAAFARKQFVASLDGGARQRQPLLAAIAQVNFDCWVMPLPRVPGVPSGDECRRRFYFAVAGLGADAAPIVETTSISVQPIPTPATIGDSAVVTPAVPKVLVRVSNAGVLQTSLPISPAAAPAGCGSGCMPLAFIGPAADRLVLALRRDGRNVDLATAGSLRSVPTKNHVDDAAIATSSAGTTTDGSSSGTTADSTGSTDSSNTDATASSSTTGDGSGTASTSGAADGSTGSTTASDGTTSDGSSSATGSGTADGTSGTTSGGTSASGGTTGDGSNSATGSGTADGSGGTASGGTSASGGTAGGGSSSASGSGAADGSGGTASGGTSASGGTAGDGSGSASGSGAADGSSGSASGGTSASSGGTSTSGGDATGGSTSGSGSTGSGSGSGNGNGNGNGKGNGGGNGHGGGNGK